VEKNIKLDTPIIFSPMSYGSVSLNVHRSLAMAAERLGILMNTGEGGLHADLYPYADNVIVQVASGRFGVNPEYLNRGAAVEIKVGQGAKPGIGGHLPGEKINKEVSETRMIPQGSDAISPAPHHDIYSIEDLRQLIYSIKEATGYKPVGVKIAAVHNVAAIASGIVRAGADYVYLDGFKGGTGAAPQIIRDHIGIPVEIAIAVVDQRLATRASATRHRSWPRAPSAPRPTWRRPSLSARTSWPSARRHSWRSAATCARGATPARVRGGSPPRSPNSRGVSTPSGGPSGSRTWCTHGATSCRRSSARSA
jgi:glutamate synthase domain-containing protein 2